MQGRCGYYTKANMALGWQNHGTDLTISKLRLKGLKSKVKRGNVAVVVGK